MKKALVYGVTGLVAFATLATAQNMNAQAKTNFTANEYYSMYSDSDLVWSDDFNGHNLNTNNWTCEIGRGSNGWGNAEMQYYTNSTENVKIADISKDTASGSTDGRALAITAKYVNGRLDSARIKTADKQSFKYGRIEARIKVVNGMQNAVWPAFWMLGSDISSVSWPACGEIDIMEHANADNKTIGTAHYQKNPGDGSSTYTSGNTYLDSIATWHTFALEWDGSSMSWYLDGNCFKTLSYTSAAMSELGNDYFILFNLAIGSTNTWFTNRVPLSSSFTSATMYVDYVRVYQKQAQAPGAKYTGKWVDFNQCHVKYNTGISAPFEYDTQKTNTIVNWDLQASGYTRKGYLYDGWYLGNTKYVFYRKPFYYMNDTDKNLTLNAKWIKVSPAKATLTVKPAKKKVTVKVKSPDKATVFQIKYGKNKAVTKSAKTKTIKKTSYTFTKLKSKTTYYFKVREGKKDSTGAIVYGKWSSVKKAKVK